MKIIYYIALILFLNSCKRIDREIVYNMPIFNQRQELKANIINDTYLFQYAQHAMLCDSLLLFMDTSHKNVIHMFNSRNGEFIRSFAAKGNGPGEVVIPSAISIDRRKGEVKINDFAKKTIVSYNLNSLLNNEDVYYYSEKLNDSLSNCYYMKFVKDSLYISNGYNTHLIFASPSKIVNTLCNSKIDNALFEDDKDWNSFMEHAVGAVSPNGGKYVEGSIIGGIMNIYDVTDNQIKEKRVLNLFKPIFDDKKRAIPETIYGFCCFSVSDNYIYALAHAKTNPTTMPKTIWKFDWDGNAIAAYECDYSIESFVVSENDKEFYASIYMEDDRQTIARYTF